MYSYVPGSPLTPEEFSSAERDAAVEAIATFLRRYCDASANVSFSPVVIHADFGRDHILVSNRRVTGVIDFSDVSFGDPDYDFSPLFIDVGQTFTMDVARQYPGSSANRRSMAGRVHERLDPPVAVLGGANGRIKGNRHIKAEKQEPTANLLLSFAELAQSDLESIGHSTGKLGL